MFSLTRTCLCVHVKVYEQKIHMYTLASTLRKDPFLLHTIAYTHVKKRFGTHGEERWKCQSVSSVCLCKLFFFVTVTVPVCVET
jgi:hypothetical protein